MKKILFNTSFFIMLLFFIAGCKKESFTPAPGEKPEERMNKAIAEYKEELLGHEYGWKAYLYADGGLGAGFYMQFADNDRVKMLSDLTEESLGDYHESTYRLKAVMAPSLLFDTDNYIHLLANPDNSALGGTPGVGYASDFEFEFRGMASDTLQLLGKKRRSKFLLVKATKEEQTAYLDGTFKENVIDMEDYLLDNQFLYITPGGDERVQVTINPSSRETGLTWVRDNVVNTNKTAYAYSVNGVHLKDTIAYDDTFIHEIKWNNGFKAVAYDGTSYDLKISPTPILPLHLLLGVNFKSILVPNATSYPGWGPDFQARRAAVNTATLASPYRLRLDRMLFEFNVNNKSLNITVDIYQTNTRFTGVFPYTFEKTPNGTFKFTPGAPLGNAALIVNEMAPLTKQRLDVDNFTLDYFTHPTTGATLGQFKSVEHPEFTFSGALQ